jgi:hypothetical protein
MTAHCGTKIKKCAPGGKASRPRNGVPQRRFAIIAGR